MAKIFLVTTNYWPEQTGIALYTTDLAETLTRNGHEVLVLTTLPHYPWWKIPQEYSFLSTGKSKHNGVSVIRSSHYIPAQMSALTRMRFELSLWWNLSKALRKLSDSDFDLVISTIPTVAAGLIGARASRVFKSSHGLIVQDLSGVGAKQSGLSGGFLITKVALFIENLVLKKANNITVVSKGIRSVVEKVTNSCTPISTIYNYSVRNIEPSEPSRERFGWADSDFVVIHTGNMGAKQNLDNVIEAAKLIPSSLPIKIYLVGHGNQEQNLKTQCKTLENIQVLPAVDNDSYNSLLSSADILLVNERETQMEMSLPSKLTSYLFTRKPVLAAVPRDGATWNYLQGIAEIVEAGNPRLLTDAIVSLSRDPKRGEYLADRGLEFAHSNLSADAGRRRYLAWVDEILRSQ